MSTTATETADILEYKGHPLRRKDNLIYYGSMAEKYIIMMQIMETKKGQGHGCRHQGRRPAPADGPEFEIARQGRQEKREAEPVRGDRRRRRLAGQGFEF